MNSNGYWFSIITIITVLIVCASNSLPTVLQKQNETELQQQDMKKAESMTVFCGSVNKPAMEEIVKLFESETGIKINMIFGGSGTLLSQIELSRKGEIYLPGSPDYIIIGNRKKLLIEDSDRIIVYLVPAIITPAGNPANIHSLKDMTKPGLRIALGNPETVCLGLYAIEILEKNQLLEEVMKNVVAFGASCSKTANLAAMKNVDAIIGWRIFHYWNKDLMTYVLISPESIPRISYIPVSIPVYTKDKVLSEKFIDFICSSKGKKVYEKLGYLTDKSQALEYAPNASIGGEYKLPDKYFELIKNGIFTR
ncbi:MAG: molybdate ABC transporter substrate-binding protein [Candidatus Schekmanbacteria bacterium RBG_13_48_7]|uniref:Molybdate ABC transporter substrate-binding protein n=1 Tax=Candidatus Schekmanbacteria bacterium RBG_13_48_7 TaxID=1817878 RepID=A0A1F7RZW1_9BACT|nr:MAG: molybdate ABC transporter substrate-binding protein [Candidatus Schekmanbacteria bacterium RBG_13_48_7]